MIEGRTILCFASGYDAPPTSKHHVMHLLAERNTILWVNYHASRTPSASGSDLAHMARKLREVASGVRRVRPNLYTFTPLVVPLPASRSARRVNRALLIGQIRAALGRLKRGPLQVWSFTPDIAYVLDHLDAKKVVYYCVDDFASFTGYDREQVLADEADLCRRADLVVTTSRALHEAKAPLNPNTILVPHGVDYEHFATAITNNLPVPEDMKDIPHPILGFFGLIRDWVDLDLLAEVARLRPGWHIVLIGDADSNVNLAAYRAIPNMHFLGRKPYTALPAYCRCFDVGLIPFKVNELTQAVNPIKLREYLAAGLPVVSTPLPEVSDYVEHVQLAEKPEETLQAVEACLTASPVERHYRSHAMAGETWPGKVQIISEAMASRIPSPRKALRRRRMKVIVGLAAGGFAIQALSLIQRCPPGVDVLLAGPRRLWPTLTERHGIPVDSLRGLRTRVHQRRQAGVVRSAMDVVPGAIACLRLLMKERPDAVMAVGQRVAIYLFLAARLTGARTVFIECVTRMTRPSLTGRVVATLGLADRFYVQWPAATRLYRRAEYAGRLI